MNSKRTALYRHYSGEELVYIGISISAFNRLSGHKSTSKWFMDISKVDIEWFENRQKALEAEANAIKTERPKFNIAHNKENIIYKPLWPKSNVGSPNRFICSSIFSSIQSRNRLIVNNSEIACEKGISIKFTGETLNQEDFQVWKALVGLSKNKSINGSFDATDTTILDMLGFNFYSGGHYHRIRTSLARMSDCNIQITRNDELIYCSSLITFIEKNEKNIYTIKISEPLSVLYMKGNKASNLYIDKLRRKHLAQSLYNYYVGRKSTGCVSVETIKKFSGSKNNHMAGFKIKVKNALEELINIGFLEGYSIENNLVSVKYA